MTTANELPKAVYLSNKPPPPPPPTSLHYRLPIQHAVHCPPIVQHSMPHNQLRAVRIQGPRTWCVHTSKVHSYRTKANNVLTNNALSLASCTTAREISGIKEVPLSKRSSSYRHVHCWLLRSGQRLRSQGQRRRAHCTQPAPYDTGLHNCRDSNCATASHSAAGKPHSGHRGVRYSTAPIIAGPFLPEFGKWTTLMS